MLLDVTIILVKIVIVIGALMLTIAYLILAERKVAGFIQERHGPNRVGPFGLLQPIADGIKTLIKEDITPARADSLIHTLAPAMVLAPALMTFSVIPFGTGIEAFGRHIKFQVVDINIGILLIFAITSIGVYGVVLGGWSSNNKYSLLGGLRSSAQMISYEIALGLSVIGIILITGSLRLNDIVDSQLGMWNIVKQPLAFIIFITAIFAETNRLPFDLAEAEQELVAGYHTEYSGFKYSMFMMGEYSNVITASALIVTLFFGGWDVPFVDEAALGALGAFISVLSFALKTAFFLFLYLWVRWTLPRFRYDQLMHLGWKVLLPLALLNLILTAAWITYVR